MGNVDHSTLIPRTRLCYLGKVTSSLRVGARAGFALEPAQYLGLGVEIAEDDFRRGISLEAEEKKEQKNVDASR